MADLEIECLMCHETKQFYDVASCPRCNNPICFGCFDDHLSDTCFCDEAKNFVKQKKRLEKEKRR